MTSNALSKSYASTKPHPPTSLQVTPPYPIGVLDLLGDGGRSDALQPLPELPPGDGEDFVPLPSPAHSLGEDLGNGADAGDLLRVLHSEDQLNHPHVVAVQGQSAQLLLALLLPEHLQGERDHPVGRARDQACLFILYTINTCACKSIYMYMYMCD